MRDYVNNDKRYMKNSIVPKEVMDDMLLELYEISKGNKKDDHFRQIFELWEVGGKIDLCCNEGKSEDCGENKQKEVMIAEN